MSLRFLEELNNLPAGDAGKPFKKIFNRTAALEMIEQTFCRDACSNENRFTSENFGVAMNDFTHVARLSQKKPSGEPSQS